MTGQTARDLFETTRDQRRLLPLVLDAYQEEQERSGSNLEAQVAVLLGDNPQLVDDLARFQAAYPNELALAILPSLQLVLLAACDEAGQPIVRAVAPTLTCTQGAMSRLFDDAEPEGYDLFAHSGGIAPELLDYVVNPDLDRTKYPTFNYDYTTESALGYVVADVQGYIASDRYGGLSPRCDIPIPAPELLETER